MQTNNILYKITKALSLENSSILEAYTLANFTMSTTRLDTLLDTQLDTYSEDTICSYEELGMFLDGLILLKRGPSPKKTTNKEVELSNNLILKKLRIALELKEAEVEIIFGLGEAELSKQNLASLFRNEKNKNFKSCSDALLLAFLDGLDEFYFVGTVE